MTPVRLDGPFAEVIESSLHMWRAQCWSYDTMPRHGSVVQTAHGGRTYFGVVHAIMSGPQDAQRSVFTFKKTHEELKRDHPHIFEFLTTTFSCALLGYHEDGQFAFHRAPTPPPIHTFVEEPSQEMLAKLFATEEYINALCTHADDIASLEELLLAMMHERAQRGLLSTEQAQRFIKVCATSAGYDYKRLKTFVQRARLILSPC